ncbi:MAG: pseudaminic acid synthase [Chloroflexi bacterium]|nr:MAG: pseudaminic acid synthase [Chloroflexota bacterium]
MPDAISIGSRLVGPGEPTYIIAELSANHGGVLENAVQLVEAAAAAGANAIKLQTYTADTITIDHAEGTFLIGSNSPWAGRTLYDLYREASTPWEWHRPLRDLAHRLGLDFFSSPFDVSAVDFLQRLDVPAYKIASPEIVDIGLIKAAAATGRPLIMSTGMASVVEIEAAVETARANGIGGVALLRCNSTYPAPIEEMDLRTIPDMIARFDTVVGLSDHTIGGMAAPIAVALGASIVEKHLTMSRAHAGPDSGFSSEPDEFAAMVHAIREAETALGAVRYGPSSSELGTVPFRRSLYVVADIAEGDVLTETNVRSIRPGDGLPPRHLDDVLGRRTGRALQKGTPLRWEDVRD